MVKDSAMEQTAGFINEHLTALRAREFAATTIHDAGELLHRVNRELPRSLGTATRREVERWLARPGWSAQTRVTYRLILTRFTAWAAEQGMISHDPLAGLPRPRVPRRLPRPATDEQVRTCLALPWPWGMHCYIAYFAGLRCCEIAGLKREHVTEEVVHVIGGKGGRDRNVPMHPRLWSVLAPLPDGPVTIRPYSGMPADACYISQATANRMRTALGVRLGLHQLRHAYATGLFNAGVDIHVIQKLLGHASLASTEVYVEVSEAQLRAAVALLPDLSGHRAADNCPVPDTATAA